MLVQLALLRMLELLVLALLMEMILGMMLAQLMMLGMMLLQLIQMMLFQRSTRRTSKSSSLIPIISITVSRSSIS